VSYHAVGYHEAFWLVVGAAAPVIALAAVVALPEITSVYDRILELYDAFLPRSREQRLLRRLRWAMFFAWGSTISNVALQGLLLLFSLTSLVSTENGLPPITAVLIATFGIWILGWGVASSGTIRRRLASAERHAKGETGLTWSVDR
jgi:hypothetical protein